MEAEVLVDTLCKTVEEVQAKTLGHTLGIVEADALVDRLADTLPEVTAETLEKGETQVDTMFDTPAEAKV